MYKMSPTKIGMSIEENGNTVPKSVDHVFRTFRRTLEGSNVTFGPNNNVAHYEEVTIRQKRTIRGQRDILGHTNKATGDIDIRRDLHPDLKRETLIHELAHFHWSEATEEDVTEAAIQIHKKLGPRRRKYLDNILDESS